MMPSVPLARALRRTLSPLLLAALPFAAACEDPFRLTASQPTIDGTYEVWAMTGAPASYPSGLLLVPSPGALPLDAAGSFDLAFDIDTGGRLMVLPVASVVSPLSGSRQVEFQRASDPYSFIYEAPRTGWTADSLLLLNEGESFLVKVPTVVCQYDLRQEVYAKIAVDSVLAAERRIRLTMRVNPNCGFRSLLSGVPEY